VQRRRLRSALAAEPITGAMTLNLILQVVLVDRRLEAAKVLRNRA